MRHTKYLPLDDRNKILTGQGGREGGVMECWVSGQWPAVGSPCYLSPPCRERERERETLHSSGQARAGLTLWFMIHNCYKLETNTDIL